VERELAIAPVVGLEPAIAPVLAELELAQVAAEREPVQVVVQLELVQVKAVPERDLVVAVPELAQEVVVPARGHPRAQLAVALRIKSVTAAHRRDLVLSPAVGDLAAAVAVTTREPAATEEVIAWVAVGLVAAEAAVAGVVAAAVVVVAEDGDKHSMRKNK
jgi:hypothetical protein